MTLDTVLFVAFDLPVTVALAAAIGAGAIVMLLVVTLVALVASGRGRAQDAADNDRRLADVIRLQNEMTGRVLGMQNAFGLQTSELARLVNERLDSQGQRLGQAMAETRTKTEESLGKLGERLAVIDRAQATIATLSTEIVSLQSILSNKQTRGAFGQGRMETIIGDQLAPGAYAFQHLLSNGSRPDCVIFMPNGAPPLVIDAKFPLESWQRLGRAETPDDAKIHAQALKRDMSVHVDAIANKYLIAGETQDTAFLFVPSESIFADLHDRFEDVVQRAVRARVMIVSPAILMLSIQVVQALLRDVKMREEAFKIQKEVGAMLGDIGRLTQRVEALQTHFRQSGKDVEEILISTGKVQRRAEKIEGMEFDEAPERERLAVE